MDKVAPKQQSLKLRNEELAAVWFDHLDNCSECEGWKLCERGRQLCDAVRSQIDLKLPGFEAELRCYQCKLTAVDTCPMCGKSVCSVCAEREGEFCCGPESHGQRRGT